MVEARLGDELSSTLSASVGFLLVKRALRRFRRRVDYSESGGALLLGVRGVVVVAHGRSSAKAIRNAILMAERFSSGALVERLALGLAGIAVTES
jgi:glycerol-3-phosphate acyltransferase PlsX